MSWRSKLQVASFRGVPFFVDSSQYQGGRRIQLNEYPLRDTPYPDDMGRKAKTYTLEAYVLENELKPASQKLGKNYSDYFAWRDALIAALELKGPGTLIHPFLGKLQVVMGVYTVSENFKEGGKATFSVPFMEAGALLEPDASADTQSAAANAAATAETNAQSGFNSKFNAAGFPSWVGSSAQLKLTQLTTSITGLINAVSAPLATVQQAEQQLGSLSSAVASLIATPSALAAEVVGAVSLLGTIVQEPIQALALYKNGLFSFGSGDAAQPNTLASQRQETTNNQAINTLVITSALTAYAQSAAAVPAQSTPGAPSPSMGYDTSDAALAALKDFLDAFDAVATNLDDDTYTAMCDLRSALVQDLQTRATSLPSLVQFTPKVTRPAIVIAWDLYGDATREQEICQRNQIADPGFVPSGIALEVLNV